MKFVDNPNSVSDLISSAFDKIKTIVDSSTVIGDMIETSDGTVIIPISKITVGYVVGGGEYADLSARRVAKHYPLWMEILFAFTSPQTTKNNKNIRLLHISCLLNKLPCPVHPSKKLGQGGK